MSLPMSKYLIWLLVGSCFPVIPLCGILVPKVGNHLAGLEGGCTTVDDIETLFSSEIFC